MSADNWAECPKCRALILRSNEKIEKEISESYGKVSEAEYVKLVKKRKTAPVDNNGPSLREDHDIGINKHGVLVISYSGSCNRCGFAYNYKHSELVFDKDIFK